MKPLDTYEDFTRHLEDREYFGQKLGLERIQELLKRLGNPERKFPSIHIAGTNGKGSTAAMIASILEKAGWRAGLFTSPHLEDFCERIRIGRELIKPDQVLRLAQLVKKIEGEAPTGFACGGGDASPYKGTLTFFEMATAIGFLHFAEEKVDAAVVETGLGGRLDATNVLKPAVSVITTIDLDHTVHLGRTVSEIAREKGGIIKSKTPLVTGVLSKEAASVIERMAREKGAQWIIARPENLFRDTVIGLAGDYQRDNAAVARESVRILGEVSSLAADEKAVREGLASVSWPGRLETVSQVPWILLDGAHNVQAMGALRRHISCIRGGRRVSVLFGAMADKNLRGLFNEISPVADRFIVAVPSLKRAATLDQLKNAHVFGEKDCFFSSVEEALAEMLPLLGENDLLLTTGSLYLIGEARRLLKSKFKLLVN